MLKEEGFFLLLVGPCVNGSGCLADPGEVANVCLGLVGPTWRWCSALIGELMVGFSSEKGCVK